jgi:mannose-1-phosphate guanylyltransferase/mannose-6-phosphate isomerase-like protein (cupin superfamily)
MRITPILLAGGEGKRLAPISTAVRPKPFIPLAGGASLLTRSLRRLDDARFVAPTMIGSAQQRLALRNHARDAMVTPRAILLEEAGHNTALAVALSVASIADDGAMLAILPADHVIAREAAWLAAIDQLCDALKGTASIGLFGDEAHGHDAAFGYMCVQLGDGAQAVSRFIEKPAILPEASPGQRWLCNMGQFFGHRHAFVAAFQAHAPDIWHAATAMVAQATKEQDWVRVPLPPRPLPSSAFDRVVLEPYSQRVAWACDVGWDDVGTPPAWHAYQGDIPLAPPRTERPWGYFTTIMSRPDYVQKTLCLYPGCRTSLQRHSKRQEHWQVVHGHAHVWFQGMERELRAGEQITIPKGEWHRLSNRRDTMLEVMEIQTGAPDEADIERKADDYGRV